jgi:hypothetical protein
MAARDAIEVRIGGKTVKDALAANRIGQLGQLSRAIVATTRLAKAVRVRAQRGDFATQRRPYRARGVWDPNQNKFSSYFISEGYKRALGARYQRYQSSAAFHTDVGRQVAGNITGGMWSGLRVRNFGTRGAVIEFSGRSLGSRIKSGKRRTNENVKVANRLKAASVYKSLAINVIQPSDAEINALGTAAVTVVAKATSFGGRPTINASGDRALARQLVSDIEAGRVTRYL